MATVNIWRVSWHYEAPQAVAPFTRFTTQQNSVYAPNTANVVSASSDGPSIQAVLTGNGVSGPPGTTLVIDSVRPADSPTAYQ